MRTPELSRRTLLAAAGASLAAPAILRAQGVVDIEFYFPVAVGGPITKIVDSYVTDFMQEHPGIRVHADLCRQLYRYPDQGGDGHQGRQGPAARRAAGGGRVLADR